MRLLTHLLHQPQPSWHQAHRLQAAVPQHQAVLSQAVPVVQLLQRVVLRAQAAQVLLPLVQVVQAAVSDTQINLA
jgi:hypothetical protein